MDAERFDRMARAASRGMSRRRAVAALGAAVGALFLGRRAPATAATPAIARCGGITGTPCPSGFVCVDDPFDGCDPLAGGADCGGICLRELDYNPCAAILCTVGSTCCPNCGGICVPADTICSDALCFGEPCGSTVCGVGEYCCNESCSICAPIGGACTAQFCGDVPPGEVCGRTVCPPGEVCCNASCGICTPPDGFCIQIACL